MEERCTAFTNQKDPWYDSQAYHRHYELVHVRRRGSALLLHDRWHKIPRTETNDNEIPRKENVSFLPFLSRIIDGLGGLLSSLLNLVLYLLAGVMKVVQIWLVVSAIDWYIRDRIEQSHKDNQHRHTHTT